MLPEARDPSGVDANIGEVTMQPVSTSGRSMVSVARLDELEDGKLKLVRVGKTPLAIVRTEGELRCFSALCTHTRIFLAPGRLTPDGLVECPMHGAKFSPVDGSVHCGPATVPIKVHEITVRDGLIFVDPGEEKAASTESTTRPGARGSAAQWGNWG